MDLIPHAGLVRTRPLGPFGRRVRLREIAAAPARLGPLEDVDPRLQEGDAVPEDLVVAEIARRLAPGQRIGGPLEHNPQQAQIASVGLVHPPHQGRRDLDALDPRARPRLAGWRPAHQNCHAGDRALDRIFGSGLGQSWNRRLHTGAVRIHWWHAFKYVLNRFKNALIPEKLLDV